MKTNGHQTTKVTKTPPSSPAPSALRRAKCQRSEPRAQSPLSVWLDCKGVEKPAGWPENELKQGMRGKSKEFVEKGAGVYATV